MWARVEESVTTQESGALFQSGGGYALPGKGGCGFRYIRISMSRGEL